MEFVSGRANITVKDELSDAYPHDLQLYREPPLVKISLHEFDEFAIERLKVLRIFEQINALITSKTSAEYKQAIVAELRRQGLKTYLKLLTSSGVDDCDYEARRRDHLSHYILQFAYCQSEELRRWFIARELEMFKFRWSHLAGAAKDIFLTLNDLNYEPLSKENCDKLVDSTGGFVKANFDYYRVCWTDVLDLVKMRKIHLEGGWAFVTSTDLVSVLASVYRVELSRRLTVMSLKLPILQEDERINRLSKNLHHTYTGKNYSSGDGKKISLQSLDALAKSSFPLCMRQLYVSLKQEHHLKHQGRQQLSLFLKGIGLSMDDALAFWRTEFTKKIDSDKFEKQYAYNIRHNYGKEGKRTNYTPYSCSKILSTSVGPGEHHGCPFKTYDAKNLKQTLITACGISPAGAQEVVNFAAGSNHQLACAKYFELAHQAPFPGILNHPNKYFDESCQLKANGTTAGKMTDGSFLAAADITAVEIEHGIK